jgi:hypothetical protein
MVAALAAARSVVDEERLIRHVMFTDDYLPCLVDSEQALSSGHWKVMCDVFESLIFQAERLIITVVWMCQRGWCSDIIGALPHIKVTDAL